MQNENNNVAMNSSMAGSPGFWMSDIPSVILTVFNYLIPQGGGVLRYISDGDVRSPFLGLKFAIWGLFLGLEFCSDFFWVRDSGKDFFFGGGGG